MTKSYCFDKSKRVLHFSKRSDKTSKNHTETVANLLKKKFHMGLDKQKIVRNSVHGLLLLLSATFAS